MNFRLASINDIEQLVQLRILMQTEVNSFPQDQVTEEYKDRVRDFFLRSIPDKKYFSIIAEDNGKIIGNAGACFYEKSPSISGGGELVGCVTNV